MKHQTQETEQQLIADFKTFISLVPGVRDVRPSMGFVCYTKRHLYNYDTPCTITISERELKNGGIVYRLTTHYKDVDGRQLKLQSGPEYHFSALYHVAADHARAIIA